MPTWKDYYNQIYDVDPEDIPKEYLKNGPVYPDKNEKENVEISGDQEDTPKDPYVQVFPGVRRTSKEENNIAAESRVGKSNTSLDFSNINRGSKKGNDI